MWIRKEKNYKKLTFAHPVLVFIHSETKTRPTSQTNEVHTQKTLCFFYFTLNMVSSSSCWGVCRVACFHGILKRMDSRSIHTRPGYRPESTCATSQGFRRTRRGVTDILRETHKPDPVQPELGPNCHPPRQCCVHCPPKRSCQSGFSKPIRSRLAFR